MFDCGDNVGAMLQGSLFDSTEDVGLRSLDGLRRTTLSRGAWIDVLPGWMTGADTVFSRLVATVPWRAARRQMYERLVDVPRLTCFYEEDDPLPDPALQAARGAMTAWYCGDLGEPFR